MASTNKTTNLELSQYVSSDKPTYLVDYNSDMLKIDTGVHTAQVTADTASTAATNAQTTAEGAQTTANTAVTNAATADGKATQAQTDIGTLANLETTAKTNIVAAANEINSKVGNTTNLETTAKNNLVAAVNELALGAEEHVLYSSEAGSAGTITLNDLISNYDRVFIYFMQSNWNESYEIDGEKFGYKWGSGNEDYINKISIDSHHLYDVSGTTGYVQEIVSTYNVVTVTESGINKSQLQKAYSAWRINSSDWNVDNTMLKIYKVIGFKK